MQRSDRWPDDYDPSDSRSRPTSRRNSASSRRSTKEKEPKKSPLNSAPNSTNSTPKRVVKPQNLEFVVTGKQILKRVDRANSLPGSHHRRQSTESITSKLKKPFESPKRVANVSHSSKTHQNSLEDDMSLDLSQVSDFEDTNSKYGLSKKFTALATSTPKPQKPAQKPRSCSFQSQIHSQKVESRRNQKSLDSSKQSRDSQDCFSRDSLYKTSSSASNFGYPTEQEYSSVSPEYSGQSSTDLSPRTRQDQVNTPMSQDMLLSSCLSTWQDCSEIDNTKVQEYRKGEGEWNDFWANYNNSIAKVPMKNYYDQCPTPYRTENIDLADFDFSTESSRKRSPDHTKNLNNIIRNEGLHLTPRETQNIIKCTHILGNVLSKAIERKSKENDIDNTVNEFKNEIDDAELEEKKKTLTLDLKETNMPIEVQEEKRSETVTTQTDISLPNTKSAPRIFENILRQLSRSSIEVPVALVKKEIDVGKKEAGETKKEVTIDKIEPAIGKKEAAIEKRAAAVGKKDANIDQKEESNQENSIEKIKDEIVEKKEANIDKNKETNQENSIEKIKHEVVETSKEIEKKE